jgi:hypothetical protein
MDTWVIVCVDRPAITVALPEGYDLEAEWHVVANTPLPWYRRIPGFRPSIMWHVVEGVELPVDCVQTIEYLGPRKSTIGFNATP